MTGQKRAFKMYDLLKRWTRDDSGATAIEYGLMAGIIAFGIIVGATALGGALNDNFDESSTALDAAMQRAKG